MAFLSSSTLRCCCGSARRASSSSLLLCLHGTDATAAVGLAAYVEWLATMLFALVGTGTTALVARCVGGRDSAGANRFTNQSVTLSLLLGLSVSLLMLALAPSFAHLQDMSGRKYEITVQYLRLDALALTFTSLTLVASAALRGAGDTRTPMIILGAVNFFNAFVSAGLVFGWGPLPEMGVTGIVVGTVAARTLGGVLMLAVLLHGRSGLRLSWASLGLRRQPARRLLRIGMPAAADGAVMWVAQFLILMIIARLAEGELGDAYYAAHMIAVRLEAFTYLPATAWAVAAATMIGQNLGAQHPGRARRAGHEAVLQCGLLAAAVGLAMLFGAQALFELMHTETIVHRAGVFPFKIVACFQPLLAISIVYVGALRGAGDTRYPLFVTALGQTLIRLPLAYLFGVVMGGGLLGAWLAMCLDFVVRGALVATRFARGKWIGSRV